MSEDNVRFITEEILPIVEDVTTLLARGLPWQLVHLLTRRYVRV